VAAITQTTATWDADSYLIVTLTAATIATQTIVDSSLNLRMYGFGVNNITGSAATLSITDGDGNKLVTDASFAGNQVQFVPTTPGYYLKNGVKISSDTDNALVVWFALRRK